VKTSFVGYCPREGCLKSNLSTMSLFPMLVLISLGGVFGGINHPRGGLVVRVSKGLCGEVHGLGFDSPWDKTRDLSGESWRWVSALAPYKELVSPKVGTPLL